jgi:malate synthase
LADGGAMTSVLYERVRDEELARLGGAGQGRLGLAARLLDDLVLSPDFTEFLTLTAYPHLD